MKTSIDQEIKGTANHIDLISQKLKERFDLGERDTPFIRYCMKHLQDSVQRLKRLAENAQIQNMEF